MRAVVLVGGEGTRLRPLTETTPKPLIPFMNRPFLHHVLDHLQDHGIEEVVLSSPHLEGEFRSFLQDRRGSPVVAWITEATPLGTCGAVVGALGLLDGTFVVCNGDILTDLDITALVARHRATGAVGTIALTRVDDARPYGLVEMDEGGRVLAFREKPAEPVPGAVNAGTYVLEPAALEGVPGGVAVSIERETFPDLIARGEPVFGFVADAYWRDLGTPESYIAAHLDAVEGRISRLHEGARRVGEDAWVDPGATVDRTVVVGAGATVGRGATVERSVLHEGAAVGENASVEDSILGARSRVGEGAVVRETVLAEGASVVSGAWVNGERARPGEAIGRASAAQ